MAGQSSHRSPVMQDARDHHLPSFSIHRPKANPVPYRCTSKHHAPGNRTVVPSDNYQTALGVSWAHTNTQQTSCTAGSWTENFSCDFPGAVLCRAAVPDPSWAATERAVDNAGEQFNWWSPSMYTS